MFSFVIFYSLHTRWTVLSYLLSRDLNKRNTKNWNDMWRSRTFKGLFISFNSPHLTGPHLIWLRFVWFDWPWSDAVCRGCDQLERSRVAMRATYLFDGDLSSSCHMRVKNIRISTDILWQVFHILTVPVPYTSVSVNWANIRTFLQCRDSLSVFTWGARPTKFRFVAPTYNSVIVTEYHLRFATGRHTRVIV